MAPFSALVDAFDTGTAPDAKWVYYGGVTISGGHLVFDPAAGANECYTVAAYDLTGDRVFVDADEIRYGPGMESALLLWAGAAYVYVLVFDSAGSPYFRSTSDVGNAAPIPYDPIAHRFWQFRESGGTLYVETSPDAVTWTVQHSIPSAPLLTSQLDIYSRDSLLAPGPSGFGGVNVAELPAESTSSFFAMF